MRSKRDSRDGGRLMLSTIDWRGSYREDLGFAAARTEVRAFNVAMIPAFATETVCCSITSCSCTTDD